MFHFWSPWELFLRKHIRTCEGRWSDSGHSSRCRELDRWTVNLNDLCTRLLCHCFLDSRFWESASVQWHPSNHECEMQSLSGMSRGSREIRSQRLCCRDFPVRRRLLEMWNAGYRNQGLEGDKKELFEWTINLVYLLVPSTWWMIWHNVAIWLPGQHLYLFLPVFSSFALIHLALEWFHRRIPWPCNCEWINGKHRQAKFDWRTADQWSVILGCGCRGRGRQHLNSKF